MTWAQSLVCDATARKVLFGLDVARQAIFERDGKGTAFDLASKSQVNLLRRWAET